MDKWDVFKQNLSYAQSADGSLQEQADIYAESWEAAQKKIKASAQSIYDNLLDDKFFIELNNTLADLLDTINDTIDTLGGVPGVLALITAASTRLFSKELTQGISSIGYNIAYASEMGRQAIDLTRNTWNQAMMDMVTKSSNLGSAQVDAYQQQFALQDAIIAKNRELAARHQELNEYEQAEAQTILQINQQLGEEYIKVSQIAQAQAKKNNNAITNTMVSIKSSDPSIDDTATKALEGQLKTVRELGTQYGLAQDIVNRFDDSIGSLDKTSENADAEFQNMKKSVNQYLSALKKVGPDMTEFTTELQNLGNAKSIDELNAAFEALKQKMITVGTTTESTFTSFITQAKMAGVSQETLDKITDDLKNGFISEGQAIETVVAAYRDLIASGERGAAALNNMGTKAATISQKITAGAQALSSFALILTSVQGIIETLKDPDTTGWEKFVSVMTTLGIVIPMATSGIAAFKMILGPTAIEEGVVSAEAIKMWLAMLGPYVEVVAAIALVVAGLVALATAINNSAHAGEIAIKKAEEQTERATEGLNNVSEAVSEVKNKLDSLTDAYDTIDGLTKGTEEWYEAVSDVNYQVSELLKKYPELSNYIYSQDGILEVSQSGMDYVTDQENAKLTAATNYQLDAQRNENQVKIDEETWEDNGLLSAAKPKNSLIDEKTVEGIIQSYYNDKQVGDQMFTEKGVSALVDAIYGSQEEMAQYYKDNGMNDEDAESSAAEQYANTLDTMQDFLETNRELIEQHSQLADTNQQIADVQLQNTISNLGSDRDLDQAKDLLGIDTYDDLLTNSIQKVEDIFGDWNNHINYSENNTTNDEWQAIQDFMSMQGDDVEYVAQRNGKMVLEIDGEEVPFTKEEVYSALAELYSGDEIKQLMTQKLQEQLSASMNDMDLSGLSLDSLVNLDNLHLQLQDALSNIDSTEVDSVFQEIIQSAGTSTEEIQEFSDTFNNIDWDNAENLRTFNAAAQELESGKITVDEFTASLEKMSAAADFDNMTEKFETAAETLGLDEDQASVMQEYAKNLSEIAEESEELSDDLATNAEAAADLAIEITRMNKGVESLADGFEDWSDVLKKSSKESQEYSEAMSGVKGALADVLDVSSDLISNDFVIDHLDDIAKAATGDADAIDALRSSMGEEILLRVSVGQSDDVVSKINSLTEEVNEAVNNLPIEDIELGVEFQDEAFLEAANNLVDTANMTADEANAYFASIGYEPLYNETELDTSMESPNGETKTEVTAIGWNDVDVDLPKIMGGNMKIKLPNLTTKTSSVSEEPTSSEGTMKLVSFSGDKKASSPIRGFRKKATGSSNNYSSRNSGGKSLGSSSKSPSSSGGGSSSQPSKKDHEKHDDSEAELYHEIKESIKDVEHEVNKLDEIQGRLFGRELIASLKTENNLLKQQRANYAELNREIEERQSAIKKTLSQYGDVDDYYTIYNNIQAAYNSAVDDYNALIDEYNSLTKEQQEANDDVIDSAKDALDENKDAMDKALDYLKEYYDNKEELRSNDEKQQELLYQQIENNLEAYETEIELKLDTTEAERSLAEFLKNMQTDIKNTYRTSSEWGAEFAADQTNANTHTQDAQTHMSQLARYKQMYANKQWGGENNIFASETDALKAITDLEQTILEDGNTLLEDYEDIYDDLIDAFDETVDQFEDIIDDFDRIDDTLDHYQKVNELLYGDSTTGMTNAAASYQVAAENSIARQSALNQYIQTLQQRRAEAIVKGYDEDDDYIKNIDDEINNKTSELESAIEDYIDTIQSELENAIQMAKETMDKTMWGGSLTDIQQEWDDKKSMAEGYYDEVEKIYELESLENKWQSAINSTSSLKAQKQLKDLMEKQVSALESKTDLSEKDVELAEKEIAVYQAQIALEEAQNSKNAMKLTRDESGNWSYQYIADEDDVADKQQSYLDKLNEYRTAAVSATEEIEESIINAYSDFTERMAEIMTDVRLTDEERATKIEELNATYYGENGIITKAVEDSNYLQQVANQATFEELWGLYQSDSEYYEQMTATEKSLIDSLRGQGIESYTNLRNFIIGSDKKSGTYGDILETAKSVNKDCETAWNSMAANAIEKMYGKDGKLDKTSVTGIVQQAYKDMQAAFTTYNNAIIASEKASGTEWSKVGIQLVGTDGSSGVKGQIDTVASAVQGVVDKISSLGEFESKVLEIENAWYSVGTSIQSATSDLDTYLSLLNGGNVVNFNSNSKKNGNNSKSTSLSNNSNSSNVTSSSSSGGDGILSVGDTATFSGKYYSSPEGASPTGGKYSGVNNGIVVDIINDSCGEYSCHIRSAYDSDDDLGWVKKSQLSGYDTGGYTGSWDGGDGRLALLHSKELVLNADDTSNFLTAVSTVRDIANLGNISNSIALGVASLVKSMLGFDNNFKGTYGNDSNNMTEGNTFNITAEFPNANNAEEIREAIMSLPTLASQYLSRNSL